MLTTENESYSLEEESVDIYTLPERKCPPSGSAIVLGDSHGRFTKLMHELYRYCVIYNITTPQYRKLVRLQQKSGDQLSKEDLTLFQRIVDGIIANTSLKIIMTDDYPMDRGDADEKNYANYRGGNDFFNFKFLEVPSKAKIIEGICYSNHGSELIHNHELRLNFTQSKFGRQYDFFFNTGRQLQRLIDRGLIDRTRDVDPLIQNHYIPHLRAVIYHRTFSISHAPFGLEQIEKLAQQFNVPFSYDVEAHEFNRCENENEKLQKTIDGINALFKMHAKEGTIHKLHDYYSYNPEKNMLDVLLYNRNHTLKGSKCLYLVHGHDTNPNPDPDGVFTLNAPVGQGRCPENTCTGTNKVLIIKPEAEPRPAEPANDPVLGDMGDIFFSIVTAGVCAFVLGAALSGVSQLLEDATRLEPRQIKQIKSGITWAFILYGLFLRESDEMYSLIWGIIARAIMQTMAPLAPQNHFAYVAATSTVTNMAVAATSSHSWPSFFSETAVRTAKSISSYYGYSLGQTLFTRASESQQQEPEKIEGMKRQESLRQ